MAKRIAIGVFVCALTVFIVVWGVMGVKIFAQYDCDVTALAYTGAACLPFIFGSLLVFKCIGAKCPHCGKFRASSGEFCPHCGKKLPE